MNNPNLISIYRSLTEEQKKKIDAKKLARHFRNWFIITGVVLVVSNVLITLLGYNIYELFVFLFVLALGIFLMMALAPK